MASDAGINSIEKNSKELFRRVAFNIFIGNHDDHFRNHGFLLRPSGWELSPAYDLNPTFEKTQALLITPYSNTSSIKELIESAGYYLISQEDAVGIVNEAYSSVRDWRQVARGLQITDTEQRRFSDRFDWGLNQYSLTTFRRRSG